MIKKKFGEQLKTLRKIANLTQEQLAEDIGINLRQLARIEAGESFVSSDTLYNICRVLNVSPKSLFDFYLQEEVLKSGTGECVYLNFIKKDNVIKLAFKEKNNKVNNTNISDLFIEQSFDAKMIALAKRLQKPILVSEVIDGTEVSTKKYFLDGEIKIINNIQENSLFLSLKNKINNIADDRKKIEYMNLAYDSLFSKEALNELKTLIKGIELIQG